MLPAGQIVARAQFFGGELGWRNDLGGRWIKQRRPFANGPRRERFIDFRGKRHRHNLGQGKQHDQRVIPLA
jgi:hypothetical protein